MLISPADSPVLSNTRQEVNIRTALVHVFDARYAIHLSDRPSAPVSCPPERRGDSQSRCSRTACSPAGVCTPKSCRRRRDRWAGLQVRAQSLHDGRLYSYDRFIQTCRLEYRRSTSLGILHFKTFPVKTTKTPVQQEDHPSPKSPQPFL